MLTLELAAARYLQVHDLEASIRLVEDSIGMVQKEQADAEDRLAELRKQKSALLKGLREAAADEGQLPLFDPADVRARLSVARAGSDRPFGEARA